MPINLEDLVPDETGRPALQEVDGHFQPTGESLEIDPGEILPELSKIHLVAAWLFSQQMTLLNVSVATGIDTLRLKQMLLYSQNFNNRVTHYKDNPSELPNYDPKETANIILSESLEIIKRRLANTPDDFSVGDLTRLVEMLSSRTDLGLNPKAPESSDALTPEAIKQIRQSNSTQTSDAIPFLEEMLDARRGKRGVADPSTVPQQVSDI